MTIAEKVHHGHDRAPHDHPVELRYIDPQGSIFELVGGDHEWVVTQYRPGHPSRVVASGPVDRLRAMLAVWADAEHGQLGS